jgi:hypothetical protein
MCTHGTHSGHIMRQGGNRPVSTHGVFDRLAGKWVNQMFGLFMLSSSHVAKRYFL